MQNIIYLALCFFMTAFVGAQTHSRETVCLETSQGLVKLKLFEETPRHKANFLAMVRSGFYDSLLFHRVIKQFMIQGGDPLSKSASAGDSLGHGDFGKPIPPEFRPDIIHRKGRLAAARESDDINPHRESSACQFYIVVGKVRSLEDLKVIEKKRNEALRNQAEQVVLARPQHQSLALTIKRLTAQQKTDSLTMMRTSLREEVDREVNNAAPFAFNDLQIKTYTSVGGTPHLDGAYTVFGEVVEGQEVVDTIVNLPTDARDRPIKDVRMRMWVQMDELPK